MTIPSSNVQLSKGYHEYAMMLNRHAVKCALDRFYTTINANRAKYRILGTRAEGRGARATFIVEYEIL